MSIKIAGRSKKLLRNILSLVKSDDKRITVSFYGKRREYGEEMRSYSNS